MRCRTYHRDLGSCRTRRGCHSRGRGRRWTRTWFRSRCCRRARRRCCSRGALHIDNSSACPDAAGVVAVFTIGTPTVHLCGDAAQVQIALVAVFNLQPRKRRCDCRVVVTVVCLPVRTDKMPYRVLCVAVICNKPAVAAHIHGLIRRILRDNRQGRSRCRSCSR